ncbi:MAG: nickel-dependent lactate racemase [Clostridiaceae bacterium]|nr:nickel-dependent lactate racemase [Clostridiaceae bacterium]
MTRKAYTIGYGQGTRSFWLDDDRLLLEMKAAEPDNEPDQTEEVISAIKNPIGKPPLKEWLLPGDRVCIVTSDITRPCPSSIILPPLIDELEDAGVRAEDITIVFALGSHRRHTEEEKRRLVGDRVYNRVHTVDSDPDDTVYLGMTSFGTPVNITESVAQADRRICVGNIEYHYFAGYSGGAKALMPGVSNRESIQANHSRMIEPTSRAGAIEGNRLRMDLEEAADICGCDFIVNVILNEEKRIVKAVAGDHRLAHRVGCAFLDSLYKIPIDRQADLVIATPGGLPKDINLYQTQKALDNAQHAVRPGGIIVLAGQCAEGYGEAVFEEWLLAAAKPMDLIERVKREFRLGGHKAVAIAMVLAKADVYFVSDMPAEQVAHTFMRPYDDLGQAVDDALLKLGPEAKVIIMPHAGSTLPEYKPAFHQNER